MTLLIARLAENGSSTQTLRNHLTSSPVCHNAYKHTKASRFLRLSAQSSLLMMTRPAIHLLELARLKRKIRRRTTLGAYRGKHWFSNMNVIVRPLAPPRPERRSTLGRLRILTGHRTPILIPITRVLRCLLMRLGLNPTGSTHATPRRHGVHPLLMQHNHECHTTVLAHNIDFVFH